MLTYVSGTLLCGAGGWAFIYAHEHDPTPQVDPEAVGNLLSHTNYNLLHYGGIALMAIGVLLVLLAMYRGVRNAP
jgi:hypothetical protein